MNGYVHKKEKVRRIEIEHLCLRLQHVCHLDILLFQIYLYLLEEWLTHDLDGNGRLRLKQSYEVI